MQAKRMICLALAVVLLCSAFVWSFPQEAAALTYQGSTSYMSGPFYRALTEVKLTGDPRTDIVNIALLEQYPGASSGMNFTEYGRWYGAQDMWCGMFASWCANVAGISTDIVPSHAYTPNGLKWFRDRGRAVSRAKVAAGEYTPQPGDLIYFKSSRNKNATNHVGIVSGYSDGVVYAIEGNTSSAGNATNGGAGTEKSYKISNTFIVYICSPDYTRSGTRLALKEPVKAPAPQSAKPVQSTKPKTPTADQIKLLRKAICAAESGGEIGYGCVSTHAGIAIGGGQWYGSEARTVLERIRTADPEAFRRLDTAGIGTDLDHVSWSDYRILPDSEKAVSIRAILSSDAGIRVQEEMLDAQATASLKAAIKLGIKDENALILCAGLEHFAGAAALNRILKQVDGDVTVASVLAVVSTPEYARLHPIATALFANF